MSKINFKRIFISVVAIGLLVFAASFLETTNANDAEMLVERSNGNNILKTKNLGEVRRTRAVIADERIIKSEESAMQVVLWNETEGTVKKPFYAVSLDGKTVTRSTETSYELNLRYGKFDPLTAEPPIPALLQTAARADGKGVYIVQYVTQPLEEYRQILNKIGAESYIYLPNHAQLVEMDLAELQKVSALPFVRWVGKYEAAYKLEEDLITALTDATKPLEPARYNIMVLKRGAEMQNGLSEKITNFGGKVELKVPEGFRLEAFLTAEQLLSTAREDEVLFIDRWTPPSTDMDIVRASTGANFIETTLGFTGQGVRGEVLDSGLLTTHVDFQSPQHIPHGTGIVSSSHGTSTYGIVFGTGTGDATARGMLPAAEGKIFAAYDSLTNRYTHTAELKQDPFRAVFQSNSWGSTQTTAYTTVSAEMDDILFKNDILILNSQSNTGNRSSRPQAWAKNIVSIGGVRHFNTASFTDDRWGGGASIGPAADGRLKPELAHFYDSTRTTTNTSNNAYTNSFGGTSGATPIVAGHFGLFFQMWHQGVFGNPTRATVFESAPHMTTSKAVIINTAVQWDMAATGTDITRNVQGFGRPDLQNLYNLRDKMLIIDETDVLTNLQTKTYTVKVPVGSVNPLKVTMTYNDPMGSPSATQVRINDLSLKVTSPDGTIYYGNRGLTGNGMWSTAGGTPNTIDTVENVFVQTPAAGNWTVEVSAADINTDARAETPSVVDADFALVVSGIERTASSPTRFDYDGDAKADISVFRPSNGTWYLNNSTSGVTSFNFGLGDDKITPADFDGDGKTDIAVFRPSNGTWYRINSSNGQFVAFNFGLSGDIPVPADFDGDAKADIAVFRPSNGTWYRVNSASGQVAAFNFGLSGDKPLIADFDGDRRSDIAVFRPANTTFYWSESSTGAVKGYVFGLPSDIATVGDFDGDGKDDISVFRPSNGNWYRVNSSNAQVSVSNFGINGDTPTVGDYDGDGRDDIAVFRNGIWYLLRSNSGFTGVNFGLSTDIPTEAAFN